MTYKHNPDKIKYIEAFKALSKIDRSLTEYKLAVGTYPDKLSELQKSVNKLWLGPYIKEKTLIDPWGVKYDYQYHPDRDGYQLYTLGSDKIFGGTDTAYDRLSAKSIKLINNPN
jgi:hypothetical protein